MIKEGLRRTGVHLFNAIFGNYYIKSRVDRAEIELREDKPDREKLFEIGDEMAARLPKESWLREPLVRLATKLVGLINFNGAVSREEKNEGDEKIYNFFLAAQEGAPLHSQIKELIADGQLALAQDVSDTMFHGQVVVGVQASANAAILLASCEGETSREKEREACTLFDTELTKMCDQPMALDFILKYGLEAKEGSLLEQKCVARMEEFGCVSNAGALYKIRKTALSGQDDCLVVRKAADLLLAQDIPPYHEGVYNLRKAMNGFSHDSYAFGIYFDALTRHIIKRTNKASDGINFNDTENLFEIWGAYAKNLSPAMRGKLIEAHRAIVDRQPDVAPFACNMMAIAAMETDPEREKEALDHFVRVEPQLSASQKSILAKRITELPCPNVAITGRVIGYALVEDKAKLPSRECIRNLGRLLTIENLSDKHQGMILGRLEKIAQHMGSVNWKVRADASLMITRNVPPVWVPIWMKTFSEIVQHAAVGPRTQKEYLESVMEERPDLPDRLRKPIINTIQKIDADVSFQEKRDRLMRWLRTPSQPQP